MKTRYEDKIKTALEMQGSAISASGILKQRIDEEIRRQGKIVPISVPGGQEVSMKKSDQKRGHFTIKKFAIGVAAACLLLSGAVFAGKTAGYRSGFTKGTYSYEELNKAEEKLGFSVDVAKQFDNGYRFDKMGVFETHAMDENQKSLYTFLELNVNYVRDGIKDITLYADKRPEKGEQRKAPDMTEQYGDITLRYDVYTYKFVPVGYELTEEDKANLARDDYEISEGADSIEYRQISHVTWEKGGVYYDLLGMHTSLTGEEMIGMAKEIIDAE